MVTRKRVSSRFGFFFISSAVQIWVPSIPGVEVIQIKRGVGTVDISVSEALDCPSYQYKQHPPRPFILVYKRMQNTRIDITRKGTRAFSCLLSGTNEIVEISLSG